MVEGQFVTEHCERHSVTPKNDDEGVAGVTGMVMISPVPPKLEMFADEGIPLINPFRIALANALAVATLDEMMVTVCCKICVCCCNDLAWFLLDDWIEDSIHTGDDEQTESI